MRHSTWLDSGSAPTTAILMLGSLALLVSATASALFLGRETVRLQQVSDLSALAGSDSRIGIIAGFACPNAEEIARVNGANLLSCRIVGEVVSVEVGKNYLGLELLAKAEAVPGE